MAYDRLFPQVEGFLHGGDYNPDQWLDYPEILEKDIELMKEANINVVSLGIFAWAAYEPTEGEFHFDWIKEIIDKLYKNGIYTILATPSGARPAWLDKKYPECRRVNKLGMREHHGWRHNHCMSSEVFREKVGILVTNLYKEVGNHEGVIMWHLSNEFGGECYCDKCVNKFRGFLKDKYHNDINELNNAWWARFWSHTYTDFDEIEPPYENGETTIMGLNLDWKRFTTWNMKDYMKSEISLIRSLGSDLPVTTNFMVLFEGLDYHEMCEDIDVISWDSYPVFHNDYESFEDTMAKSSFDHAVMRSMKRDKPFMLMESAPGLVNWHEVNKLKRPYVHRLFGLQTIGCGSDTIQYFQIRKGRGAYEQFHGAVIDHVGTNDTRTFKEVASLGKDLIDIKEIAGSLVDAKAAVIYDWDTLWSINDARIMADASKKYPETVKKMHQYLSSFGLDVDVISVKSDFSPYKIIIAPMLYMIKGDLPAKLEAFVKDGGQLLATYATGYVNESTLAFLGGFPGAGLKDLFGIVSEDIDTLYPSDSNSTEVFGVKSEIKDYAEILRVKDAEVLATYADDFYAGQAALTRKSYDKGNAYYMAARLDEAGTKAVFAELIKNAGLKLPEVEEGIEYHKRVNDTYKYEFFCNMSDAPKKAKNVKGHIIQPNGEADGEITVPAHDVIIVRSLLED